MKIRVAECFNGKSDFYMLFLFIVSYSYLTDSDGTPMRKFCLKHLLGPFFAPQPDSLFIHQAKCYC